MRDCFQWEEKGKQSCSCCYGNRGRCSLQEERVEKFVWTAADRWERKRKEIGSRRDGAAVADLGRREEKATLRTRTSCHIHLSPREDTFLQHGANDSAILTLHPSVLRGVETVPAYPTGQTLAGWNKVNGYSETLAGAPRVSVTSQQP